MPVTNVLTLKPAVTANSYTANQIIGGVLTVPLRQASVSVGGGCQLVSVVVIENQNQKQGLTLHFFSAQPVTANQGDRATFGPSNADFANYIGAFSVLTSDYSTVNGNNVEATKQAINLSLAPTSTTNPNIYVFVVTNGTPTYTANCLQIKLGLLHD